MWMSKLEEIESAADALDSEEKQRLLLFLATRLRGGDPLPEPRKFSREQMDGWIAEDEADLRRFQQGQ